MTKELEDRGDRRAEEETGGGVDARFAPVLSTGKVNHASQGKGENQLWKSEPRDIARIHGAPVYTFIEIYQSFPAVIQRDAGDCVAHVANTSSTTHVSSARQRGSSHQSSRRKRRFLPSGASIIERGKPTAGIGPAATARRMIPAESPSVTDSPNPAAAEKPLRSLRILVVDDEPGVRTFIAASLRRDGHEVETVSDGVAALALQLELQFDAIIADLVMPGMSGLELASAIKRLSPGTPLICVTGHTEDLENSPFDLIIQKPFAHPVLRAAIDLFCA